MHTHFTRLVLEVPVRRRCSSSFACSQRDGERTPPLRLGGWPGCHLVLCTVKPRRPKPHAQQLADHARVTVRYVEAGFGRLRPVDEMLALLRRARSAASPGPVAGPMRDAGGGSPRQAAAGAGMGHGCRQAAYRVVGAPRRRGAPTGNPRRRERRVPAAGPPRAQRPARRAAGTDLEAKRSRDWREARVRGFLGGGRTRRVR